MKLKQISILFMIASVVFSFKLPIIANAASAFTAISGSVIIEAENTAYTEAKITNLYKGYTKSSSSSASGGYFLTPGTGASSSSTPSGNLMNFTVTAGVAGRYTLWVRAKASAGEEAMWFEYNNNGYKRTPLNTSGSYAWVKLIGGYYMNNGGSVRFNFYPKDKGNNIDCFIFTKESSYVPSGIVSSAAQIVSSPMPQTYGIPLITPPSTIHPRLMLRSSDAAVIKTNASSSQNTAAKSYFNDLVADYSFSGALTITPGANNFDFDILSKIEAHALNYALYGTVASGNKAASEIINYLQTVCFNPEESNITREMGSVIFRAAEVYDWCYAVLTPQQRNNIISYCEDIASGMETGYPQTIRGNVTGHGSEFGIFRDMLALGIAVYDERPDIYNHVMGRIEKEMVAARDFYYQSHSGYQGTNYSPYRYHAEVYAELMIRRMTEGQGLFSEDFKQVPYSWIYLHRPDGMFYKIGDDSSTTWNPYNTIDAWPAFIAGNLFNDKLIKGEFTNGRGTVSKASFDNSNYNNYKCFNSVLWLLINNPSVPFDTTRANMAPSRYFGAPNGMIIANSKWEYSINNPSASTAASALMKIGEVYGGNHDHLDAGSFQLYYKGILASASGTYGTYGDSHDINYYKRTIASNTLTVYNSAEKFGGLNPTSNDGGQRWPTIEALSFATWRNGEYDRAKVLDYKIGDNNSFSYIRGDLTDAYSNKVSNVQRAMAFVSTNNADFPAFMAIYDTITSTKASYTKKFILNTQEEPSISGNTASVTNTGSEYAGTYNGKMNVTALLPSGVKISKVGGSGSEYSVNGTNYPATSNPNYAESGWGRLEISPTVASTVDEFLTILTVSDADNPAVTSPVLISGTNLKGAKVLNKVVMFSSVKNSDSNRVAETASFTISGEGEFGFMVFGLKAGMWQVARNGVTTGMISVDENSSSASFEGISGGYTLSYVGGPSVGAGLLSLEYTVNGNAETLKNFYTNVHQYNVTVPANTTQLEVSPKALVEGSAITVGWKNINNGKLATVNVVYEEYTAEYFISFIYADSYILGLNVLKNDGIGYDESAQVWKDLSGSGNDVQIPANVISGWTEQGLSLFAPIYSCDEETVISGNGNVIKKPNATVNAWMDNGSTATSRALADYLEVIATGSNAGMILSSDDGAAFTAGSTLSEDRFSKISFDYKNGAANNENIQFRVRWGTVTGGSNDQWIYCRPNDICSNKNGGKVIGNYKIAGGYTHFDLVFNLRTGTSYAFIDGNAEPADVYTISNTYLSQGGLQNIYFYGTTPDLFYLKKPEKVLYTTGTTLDMIKSEISNAGIMLPQAVCDAVGIKKYTISFTMPQITEESGKNTSIISSLDGSLECYRDKTTGNIIFECVGINQALQLDGDMVTAGYNTIVVNASTRTAKWYINGELMTQSSFVGGATACSGVMLSSSKNIYGGSAVIEHLDWYNAALDQEVVEAKYTEYFEENFKGVCIKDISLNAGVLSTSLYVNGDFSNDSVILAAYQDGILVNIRISDYTEPGYYNTEFSVPIGFDGYVRAFVWDIGELHPYAATEILWVEG